jgi:cell division transport system permease protein
VVVILLFFVNVVVVMNQIKTSLLSAVDQKIDIPLFFKQEVPEAEVLKIEDELNANPVVSKVVLITPDAGLEQLKNRHPELGEKILPALGSNPLGYTLKISAKELDQYPALLDSFDKNERLLSKLDSPPTLFDSKKITATASKISDQVNTVAIILVIIFFMVALLIMFNSIRVSIYTHREEIGIMKLVGATNRFIRMPFVIESIMYSLISVLITIGILYFIIGLMQPFLNRFFGDLFHIDLIGYYNSQFIPLFGLQLIGITFLAVVSTTLALRRYLRA